MGQARSGIAPAALGAAGVTVVLWAAAFVGIRAAGADFAPGSIALARLTTGTLILGVLVLARGWVRPTRRELVLVLGVGATWFATYNVVLNEAERIVDAGTAAMLVDTGPILIAILAGLFLSEGFPPSLFAGSLVAFAGAVVIGVATSEASVTSRAAGPSAAGILLCLVAATVYAVGVTLQKPVLGRLPAVQVTWMACLVGAALCLPFAPGLVTDLGRAHPDGVAWLAFLGVFPTSIAFTTWAYALGRTTAGALGATTYLVPPIAIVLGWLLLGEAPPLVALGGGGLCIAGVIVARSRELRLPGRTSIRTADTGAGPER